MRLCESRSLRGPSLSMSVSSGISPTSSFYRPLWPSLLHLRCSLPIRPSHSLSVWTWLELGLNLHRGGPLWPAVAYLANWSARLAAGVRYCLLGVCPSWLVCGLRMAPSHPPRHCRNMSSFWQPPGMYFFRGFRLGMRTKRAVGQIVFIKASVSHKYQTGSIFVGRSM